MNIGKHLAPTDPTSLIDPRGGKEDPVVTVTA
jgi:hypothetical protein